MLMIHSPRGGGASVAWAAGYARRVLQAVPFGRSRNLSSDPRTSIFEGRFATTILLKHVGGND